MNLQHDLRMVHCTDHTALEPGAGAVPSPAFLREMQATNQ
jgi:hypothetical protein